MQEITPTRRVLFRHCPKVLWLGVFAAISILLSTIFVSVPTAQAATDDTINFQARLENSAGAIAPDGNYNVEFKLYDELSGDSSPQGSCGTDTHCLWDEDYTSTSGSGGSDVRVSVANGYLTVDLGSANPFPNTINWDQNLYLSIRIGGTSSTPSWDAEMSPRLHLTGVPYAFQAQSAAQLQALAGSYTGTLDFSNLTGGNQTFQLSDMGAAGTYGLLALQNTSSPVLQAPASGSWSFNVGGVGEAGSLEVAPTGSIDTSSSGTLNIGTTHATGILFGQNVTFANGANRSLVIATAASGAGNQLTIHAGNGATGSTGGNLLLEAGANGTANGTPGSVVIKANGGDSTTALQVQNASGNTVLTVDTASNSSQGQVVLGKVNANNGVLLFESYNGGSGGGAVTLQAPSISSANSYSLVLPTLAPTGSGQCLQTSSATQLAFGACGAVGSFINNQTTIQTAASFYIQPNSGSVGGVIEANGADILDLKNSSAVNVVQFDQTGNETTNGNLTLSGSTPQISTSTANVGLNINANGTGTLSLDTTGGGTVNVGNTHATTVNVGNTIHVNTANGYVGIGAPTPTRQLDIATNNAAINSLPVLLQQAGSGDTGIEYQTVDGDFFTGIDSTDGQFKIASSTSANGTFNVGDTTQEASNDFNAGATQAYKIIPGASGTVVSMSVYITAVDGTNPLIQLGVYSDTSGSPHTLLGSSSATTAAVGWNTFTISGGVSLISGASYWIALSSQGTTHFAQASTGGSMAYQTSGGYPLPSTFTVNSTSGHKPSFYLTVASASSSDNFGGTNLFTLGATGATVFQNSTNSATAFQVQNAGGNSVLSVNTSTNQVVLGKAGPSGLSGSLVFQNSSNANTIDIVSGVTSTSYTLTLPTAVGTSGECLEAIDGAGTLGWTGSSCASSTNLQQAYNNSAGASPSIDLTSTNAGFTLQNDATTSITGNLFAVQDKSNAGTLFSVANTGATTVQTGNGTNNYDTTSAFQVQNHSGTKVLGVDTTADANNLLSNGSFEIGNPPTSWTGKGGGTLQRLSTTGHYLIGSSSMRVTTSAASGDGTEQAVTLSSGKTYAMSVYAEVNTTPFSTFDMGYYDGTTLHSCSPSPTLVQATNSSATQPGNWTYITCTFTTSTVGSGTYIYFDQTDVTSRNIFLDGATLEQVSTPVTYRDGTITLNGDITSQTTFENANNSTTAMQVQNATGGEVLDVDTTNGRVGIGTSAPAYPLDVVGNVNISSGSSYMINGSSINAAGTLSNVAYLNATSQIFTGVNTFQDGITVTGAAANLNASSNFGTNINTGTSTGAVAIGNGAAGAIGLTTSSANSITLTSGATTETLANGGVTFNNNVTVGTHTLIGSSTSDELTMNGASGYTLLNSNSGGGVNVQADYLRLTAGGAGNVQLQLSTDTSISRGAAGVLDVGNGTYQDHSGTLIAGTLGANTLDTAGAAGTLDIAATNATTVNVANTGSKASTVNIATNGLAANTVNLGSSNSSANTNIYGGLGLNLTGGIGINLYGGSGQNVWESLTGTGDVIKTQTTNSATAFAVQNAGGNNVLGVDTSGNQVVLGKAGAGGLTGKLQFLTSGVSGSISLASASPGTTNYTLTLPAETGTLCSTAGSAACTAIYAPASGSANYIQNQNTAAQASSNFWISGTGIANTALEAPLIQPATTTGLTITGHGNSVWSTDNSGVLTIQSAGSLNLGNAVSTNVIVQAVSGGTVSIGASANNTINIGTASGSSTAITIGGASETGALTMQSQGITQALTGGSSSPSDVIKTTTNSAGAFQVQDNGGNADLNVDTQNDVTTVATTNSSHVALKINSGSTGTSGLQLTQLTSSSSTSSSFSQLLGVDSSGNVGLSSAGVSLTSPALAYWDGLNSPTTGSQSYPPAIVSGTGTGSVGSCSGTWLPTYSSGNGVELNPACANTSGSMNWNFSQVPFEESQFQFKAGTGAADATWFYGYTDSIPTTEYGCNKTPVSTCDTTYTHGSDPAWFVQEGYIVYFSEFHNCIGISYGGYKDGNQCNNGGGTSNSGVSPLKSVSVGSAGTTFPSIHINDNNFHQVDIQVLDNVITVRWDGQVILTEVDSYGRDTSHLNYGFAARSGSSTNTHYIKSLLVTKLGTNVSEYNINDTSPLTNNIQNTANNMYWQNSTGSLGINTYSPGANMEIDTSSSGTIGQIIQGSSGQSADLLELQDSSGTVLSSFDSGGDLNVAGGVDTQTATTLNLGLTNASAISMGANTTINGTLKITGTTTVHLASTTASGSSHGICKSGSGTGNFVLMACGSTPTADYAEIYPTDGIPTAGDLVMPSGSYVTSEDGQYQLPVLEDTRDSYEPSAMGVISQQTLAENDGDNTLTGNNVDAADHPEALALNGRVLTKVDTENGAIEPGDYITASSTPGVGMKATRAGQVVGQALASYDGSGVGQILVLVNPTYYSPSGVDTLQATSAAFDELGVTGTTTTDTLKVSGDTSLQGSQNISGDLSVNGKASLQGGAAVTGGLNVSGNSTTASLSVDGDLAVNGNLTVSGSGSITDLTIQTATVGDSLDVAGSTTTGTLNVAGSTTTQTLTVSGAASFGGDIKLTAKVNTRQATIKTFIASKPIKAGSVVILDDTDGNEGQVTTTAKADDTRVIGVAVTAADNKGDKVDVAIGGWVQVSVDTTKDQNGNLPAPIVPGQLLVTSANEGTAQTSADPQVGSILGKSTSKQDSNNQIWLLITLQ